MKKIIFVILHYIALDDTVECIDSICELNYENIEIIVVDNGSPNNSGQELENKYSDNQKVHVILNEKNLGFANGNNTGFSYGKSLNPDFIVLINNDTIVCQNDFCQKIVELYQENEFAVLGPMILTADGKYTSNPISNNVLDKDEVEKRIKFVEKQIFIMKFNLTKLNKIYGKIKKKKTNNQINYYQEQKNVRLHGACLIFSKEYINMFDGLDSRTFMYEEERFLQKRLVDNNLSSLYSPQIFIYHKEDVATDKVVKNYKEKQKFYLYNDLKSLKILISDYE